MGILRFYLAYVVLLSHCPEGMILKKISHPALAVQCFYAISGFYVQLLIFQFSNSGKKWVLQFYTNRVLRIYPTYLILFLLSVALLPSSAIYLKHPSFEKVVTYLSANVFLITQGLMRFLAIPVNVLPQAWTLSLEWMFYLLAPFILLRSNRLIFTLIIAGMVLRLVNCFYFNLYLHDWFYGFFPCELPLFLMGSLGYRFYVTYLRSASGINLAITKLLSVLVSIYLVWFTFYGWLRINTGQWDGASTLGVPMRYWAVLFLTTLSLPFLFHLTKNFRLDKFIGEFSYPLYLSHFLFISLYEGYVSEKYLNVLVLISSLLFSYFVIKYVEIPVSNYRQKLKLAKDNQEIPALQPA